MQRVDLDDALHEITRTRIDGAGDSVAPDTERSLTVLHARMRMTSPGTVTPGARLTSSASRAARRFSLRRQDWGITVAAVIGIVIGLTLDIQRTAKQMANFSSIYTTYTTANGERAKIVLPDGSTATLNAGSRLEVPANYALGSRTVRLEGEALFTVDHYTGVPFIVQAGPSTTRVLGTSFIVRHYPTDSVATVAVRDGKVSVQSTILTAHQQVDIGQFGVTPVQRASAGRFSFATGLLPLTHVRLLDAIPDLNRWYDADIRIGDVALTNRYITLDCANESLADLETILELALDIRVERNGRVLTLFSR